MVPDPKSPPAAKALIIQSGSPGSQPLRKVSHELYARYRAQALPRDVAYRKANQRYRSGYNKSYSNESAYSGGERLERKNEIQQRIQYLTKTEQDVIINKRQAIEEKLWAIHEANIKDFFETYEQIKTNDGKPEITETGEMVRERRERPRLISDLPDEAAMLIEDVSIDARGRIIPKLYSRLAASKELRAMLNIGKPVEGDVSRLSDAELVQQLSDQARELGIDIKLNYTFAQPPKAEGGEG